MMAFVVVVGMEIDDGIEAVAVAVVVVGDDRNGAVVEAEVKVEESSSSGSAVDNRTMKMKKNMKMMMP